MDVYVLIARLFGLGMLFVFGGGLSFVVVPWWLGVFNAPKGKWIEAYTLYVVPVVLTWVYDLLITFRLTDTGFTVNVGPLVLVPAVMIYSVKLLAPAIKPTAISAFVKDTFAGVKVGLGGRRILRAGEKVQIFEEVSQYCRIGKNEWVDKQGLRF